MGLEIRCSRCGKQYVVADTMAGKRVKCRQCGLAIDVTAAEPPPEVRPRDLSDLLDEAPRQSQAAAPPVFAPPPGGFYGGQAAPHAGWAPRQRSAPASGGGVPAWIWIVLGLAGGVFVVCCGGVWGLGRLINAKLDTSPEAREPFPLSAIPVPKLPERGAARTIENGIQLHEVQWGPGGGYSSPPGTSGKMWLYLPAGQRAPGSLSCVLIAGAGSTLLHGMQLSDGDRPEHLPYVRQGIAVLAYELDGPINSDAETARGYQAFKAAQAGLVNARNALEFVLAKAPEVNRRQIYAAGHSSAATVAMLFAEHEPRLAGCMAYAPAIDLEQRFGRLTIRQMSGQLPGLADFVVRSSPRTHEARLHCPLWLFHALDDSNVPASDSRAAAGRLKKLGKDVTLKTVPRGDHYDSMIQTGIPGGIQWIKQRAAL